MSLLDYFIEKWRSFWFKHIVSDFPDEYDPHCFYCYRTDCAGCEYDSRIEFDDSGNVFRVNGKPVKTVVGMDLYSIFICALAGFCGGALFGYALKIIEIKYF